MIKKARIKFICIIMAILFVLFVAVSLITSIILHSTTNKNIDHVLDDMVKIIPYANQSNAPENSFIFNVDNNLIYYYDNDCYTQTQLTEILNEIHSRTTTMGRAGNVVYKIVSYEKQNFIIAIDATNYFNELNSSLLTVILIFIGIYLLQIVVVYLISLTVFEPIKVAFAKQRQFVSNASHELKTPLTIISANADVIKQKEDNQWIENIKNQAERLELLIADMLEIAKIDEGVPKTIKETFNVSEQVIKSVLPFDSLAFEKGKNLVLDVMPDITYNGDSQSVKKLLDILLDNAIKYASPEGLIKVSLYKKNRKIILSVYNTGSAVPSNQVDKIFERFYRFDNSRSRESGGSGLGLAIAKGIANTNGWKISAVSKPNEYMNISVIL